MFETIVVGTDGSETASIAVGRAAELAAISGAELIIVSAYKPVPTRKVMAERAVVPDEFAWMLHSEQEVQGILSDAKNIAGARGVQARGEARTEEPVEAVLAAAAEFKAGVIVVGSRGMERRVMGSVPNSIAHRAACDVYIVQTV